MSDKAKILIIDDDEDYRTSTRALLEGEGYEVLEADCGRKGLEAARGYMPDLIVLDIMMESPVEGYTVVQALKFRNEYGDLEEIPIIMVSSVKQDPASLFPMAGDLAMITPDAYFTKPIDIQRFLPCVKRMLEE
ncbi:MAG: response regulator [Phycisphaerae bacterium]|nr:response regulator [Phycisphaerae bacterium]